MAIYFWSWIFIFQTLFIRFSYAHVTQSYEALTERAIGGVFIRGLTKAEKERNTFIGLAIAGGVVLVAGLIGLLALYLKQREKLPELESGAVPSTKPHWWMVDEKKSWWRLSSGQRAIISPTTTSPTAGSRIERLREVLNIPRRDHKGSTLPTVRPSVVSPAETIDLPLQTDPNIRPDYPESLERGYRAPIYPIQSPPRLPMVITTVYDGGKQQRSPTVPPRALVTQGQRATLSRSGARHNGPRSPAGRRYRNSVRNPFLPLKDSDTPMKISAPTPIVIDSSNPKLGYSVTMSKPRTAPTPPQSQVRDLTKPTGGRKPAPLPLSAARVGLPGSPRPAGLPGSPRPRRPITPAI